MMKKDQVNDKIEDEKWKKYVLRKLHHLYKTDKVEAYMFSLTMFENFFPHTNRFRYIRDVPIKKYRIEHYRHIKVPTRDGLKLDAWFFPVKNPRATILVLHGSGYNMADHSLPRTKFLLDHHYQLLLFNARYWNYAEKPQEYVSYIGNDLNDIEDVIAWMKASPGIDNYKVAIFGLSSGGYKAGLIASRMNEVKIAVLDSPAAGIFFNTPADEQEDTLLKKVQSRLKQRYGFDLLLEQFNIFTQIKKVTPKPLLFLHGDKDKITPKEKTSMLYELAGNPKEYFTFPHSGHCDAMFTADKEMYVRAVTLFLNKYMEN